MRPGDGSHLQSEWRGADLGERVQHPLAAFVGNVDERDRMRRLGEHPREDPRM
jgi:hypothetical protein